MADTTVSHTNGHTVPETEYRGIEKKLESSVSALSSSGSSDGTPDATNGTKSEEPDVSIALNAANIDAVPSLIKEINALSGDLDSDDPTARLKLMAKAKSLWQSLETPRETMLRHVWAEPSLHCALTAGTVKEVWTHVAKIDGPFKVADVAKEKNIEPALLARLVRHVSSMGYITEIDQDTYQATNFIKSMAFPFINAGYPCISGACLNALGQFHEWADINSWKDATDISNSPLQLGYKTEKTFFEHLHTNPPYGQLFHLHMGGYRQGRPSWMDAGFFPVQEKLANGFEKSDDAAAVTCARQLSQMGKSTIMINYNPETVSTDFDEADRLYFEELGWERVMDIYEIENSEGVVVSVGGQLPQNIALRLKHSGVTVLGTDPDQIDIAEDRHKFSAVLDTVGVDQPAWAEVSSLEAAKDFAREVGYPVLIRPSYVLSGAAMNVVHEEASLEHNLSAAASVSPLHPVVITKFIQGAQEIDLDGVAYNGQLIVHAVSEHVEQAGVHSGDATLVLPPHTLPQVDLDRVKEIAQKVAGALKISGPFNMQIIRTQPTHEGALSELKVIECNLRASRSFPFVSKVLGHNFVETAAAAIAGQNVPEPMDLMAQKRDYVAIKVPQFSWTRLAGADPFLGVEMASTGEVASFGKNVEEAYWASLLSTTGFRLPQMGSGVLIGGDPRTPEMAGIAKSLSNLGFHLYCSSKDVEEALNDIPYVVCKRIIFPTRDKRKLREVFDEYDIQLVFNLSPNKATEATDQNYVARRNAVDFGYPLLNNAQCAQLFVRALEQKVPKGGLRGYREGRIPSEVRSWSEFLGYKA